MCMLMQGLKKAICLPISTVNLPTILAFFYKGIAPFMDPVTRDKVCLKPSAIIYIHPTTSQIRFNSNLSDLIPGEQLDADFGGDFKYDFEPESYWQQIVKYVFTKQFYVLAH